MCVIIPVDHLSCTHTVAVWQHCAEARPSPFRGLEPCSRIRQHGRPILTRKLCINCGGPRVFGRRDGIAERREGYVRPTTVYEDKEEEACDSGYHSDIMEEEEEDDESLMSDGASAVSPRASVVPKPWRPMYRTHRRINTLPSRRTSVSSTSSSHSRSSSGGLPPRKLSWKPNLKQELLKDQPGPFGKRVSDASMISQFEDEIGKARRSNWGSIDLTTSPIRPMLTKRKGSTLLHPSPAPTPEAEIHREELLVSEVMIRPRLTKRQGSSLLHPSPADDSSSESATRPEPVRKTSTLLHPSEPPTELSSSTERRNAHAFPFPLNVSAPQTPSLTSTPSTISDTSSITTPSPLITLKSNNTWVFPPQKPKHTTTISAFTKIWKDEEEEENLWPTDPEASAASDAESLHEGETKGFSIVMAQTARLGRASQVTLGGHVRSRSAWT